MAQETLFDDLDKLIDAGISAMPFSDRSAAVIHFLRSLEGQSLALLKNGDPEARNADCSLAMDAATYCMSWIAKLPDIYPSAKWIDTTLDELQVCDRLFNQALRYTKMCDLLMAFRQRLMLVAQNSENVFSFSYASDHHHELEVSDWELKKLLAARSDAAKAPIDTQVIADGFKPSEQLSHNLLAHVSNDCRQYVFDWMKQSYAAEWELSGSIQLDGFSLGDCRQFWLVLRTLAAINIFVSRGHPDIPFTAAVPLFSRSELVAITVRLASLDVKLAEKLVDYFVYDFGDVQRPRRAPNAILQPIFPVGQMLALSPFLILESNIEVNIFHLLNSKTPKIYDGIKDTKEKEWSEELVAALTTQGLFAKPQMSYPLSTGKPTNLDVVVIDVKAQIGMVLELKWQIGGRFTKTDHINYLKGGFGQALRAVQWIESNRSLTEEKLELPKGSLQNCVFHPLVVAKDSLLNGLAQDDQVPLICDRLLKHWLGKRPGDLQSLWTMASEKTYLAAKGRHFGEAMQTTTFNAVSFHSPKTISLVAWNPDVDIRFP